MRGLLLAFLAMEFTGFSAGGSARARSTKTTAKTTTAKAV
jgi:hypothetical protein